MDLADLHYFSVAASSETLSEAAAKVPISQPGMSAALKRLEDDLGAQLILRSRGRGKIRLTPAGERVLRGAQTLLSESERMRMDLRRWERVEHGSLRIGAGTAALEYFLPGPVSRLIRRYPGLRLSLHEGRTGITIEQVRSGEIDLGIVTGPTRSPDLLSSPWVVDPLVCVGPPELAPGARVPQSARALLSQHRLISYGEGELQDQIDEAVKSLGIDLGRHSLIVRSGEAMKQYISAGLGIGFLSSRTVRVALSEGRLTKIPLTDLNIIRQYELICRPEPNPAVDAFKEVAELEVR